MAFGEITPVYLNANTKIVIDVKNKKWRHAYVYEQGYEYLCGRANYVEELQRLKEDNERLSRGLRKLNEKYIDLIEEK